MAHKEGTEFDKMITGGLVTMEKVRALHYRGAVSDGAQ
jgi:hypothetical protein